MNDLIFAGTTVVFFLLCIAYVGFCEKVR